MTRLKTGRYFPEMNRMLRVILFFFISCRVADGQILSGRISDKSGEPVQYATIFIKETRQGTTSNPAGDYRIHLQPGQYTVLYQSLGYEPITVNIALKKDSVTKNVVLTEQIYDIGEVKIAAAGEDPAYPIMRKAIGFAPYYLNNIRYYKADVYLKGNLVIRKIPGIARRSLKIESGRNASGSGGKTTVLKEGDSFFMESFNEIEYTAPDNYVQKVISFNSTLPGQGNEISPMDYIKASFYQPVMAQMAISPLSPSAFSHYRFRYLGSTPQDNFTISKIEVIPKRKSQQLFTGVICIIDDLWCLQSVDLTNENLAGTIQIKQLYIPVEDDLWMPVSHAFTINIMMMGFRAEAGYEGSVKYLEVEPNSQLERPDPFTGIYAGSHSLTDTTRTKTRLQIESILQKEDLTKHDMVRLSNLMKKEAEKSVSDTTGKNPETRNATKYIVEKDALKKDTAYWAVVRPIPLSETERRSLVISDSLRLAGEGRKTNGSDTTAGQGKRKNTFGNTIKTIASGKTWADTSGTSFIFGGLVKLKNINFNSVDGVVYGTDFRISHRFRNRSYIGLYPELRYAFSREKLMWRANLNFSSGGTRPSQIFLRSGMTSRDFNTSGNLNPLINSITSLFLKRNYMKLYDSRYISVGYRFGPARGLRIEIIPGYEERRVLNNNTSFSVFRKSLEYSSNAPVNDFLVPGSNPDNYIRNQRHFEIVTNITFTPYQKNSTINDGRSSEGSSRPDFRLTWKHGMNNDINGNAGYSHFDMITFGISHRIETGAFSSLRWRVSTGGFADNRNLSFYDFFHFNEQPVAVLIDDYDDAFMLPSYYSLSTPEFYGEAHFRYTTPYLFLKLLPGLSNTLTRENISFSYLGSRNHTNYTEIGYSLSEIFFIAEAGVYAGFDDLKFRSISAKLILRFNR